MFINEKLPLKTNIPIFFAPAPRCSVPPLRGGFPVSIIPLFHVAGKEKMPFKTFYFNKFYNFREVKLRRKYARF
jgi:hypothetical protein